MKTDRLLAIVIHLLGHETVSAAKLAERFEVSKRTIMRDIDQIAMAGIPIKSQCGINGGYSIMEGYKLDGRLINAEEQAFIITALSGFLSSYDDKRYYAVLEKFTSILPGSKNRHIFLDFGASGEINIIQEKLTVLDKAILAKKTVRISYVNALGEASSRIVEPVALNYRWYAWYLLAYCQTKRDYRIFKLARIGELESTETKFTKQHGEPAALLEQAFQGGGRKLTGVTLLCKAEARVQICEYLGGNIIETRENGDFIMRVRAQEDERTWFAMLLSFGDKITVQEPEELKTRLAETAGSILSLYKQQ
ncbi:MAG: YafY family transcriptional regulator [Defluviitaleaceae bacterium]|nr:YafY family transcriptional regulator [Defluviitaleaceae bacterium]